MERRFQNSEEIMTCVICRHGRTILQNCTVVLEREGGTIVFRQVPGQVCENCGEQYLSAEISARLLEEAERALGSGVQIEVRNYVAA